jgi:tape measure domain-containing protein
MAATTIAAYNVSFAMKTSGLVDNSKLARNEVMALKATLSSIKTPADTYEKSLNALTIALEKGAITQEHYNRALRQLNANYDQATAKTKSWLTTLGSVRAGLAALAGSALVATAKGLVNLAGSFESTRIQFEVLAGDVNVATDALRELRELAAASPLSFQDVAAGAKTMVAFGVTMEQVVQVSRQLADISMGNADRFGSLALAFGQTTAAGRLMGAEVLQFINAGFNPLQQISKKTGESMAELKKRMEAGAISAKEVAQAMIDATSAGGKFHGMTETLSTTIDGRLQQSFSRFQEAGAKLGEAIAPALLEAIEAAADLASGLNDIGMIDWTVTPLLKAIRLAVSAIRDVGDGLLAVYNLASLDPKKRQKTFDWLGGDTRTQKLADQMYREDQNKAALAQKAKDDAQLEINNKARFSQRIAEVLTVNPQLQSLQDQGYRTKAMTGDLKSKDMAAMLVKLTDAIQKQHETQKQQLETNKDSNKKLENLKPAARVR